MSASSRPLRAFLLFLVLVLAVPVACRPGGNSNGTGVQVPHEGDWGIYALDLDAGGVELIWSSDDAISYLTLNHAGNEFAFCDGQRDFLDPQTEICAIGVDGEGWRRLTGNPYCDVYPTYSPDGSRIAFLSLRGATLDLYVMGAGGGHEELLYDSGYHDADVNSGSRGRIAFTRNSQIWTMAEDGSDARQVTSPPRAGELGKANLPFGDYDPCFSPDGSRIAFERLEDDASEHGNYNLFAIDAAGGGETRLTDTGYSQGLPVWSHSGDKLVYIVAAAGSQGRYDIHLIEADGASDRNITADFPAAFLCRSALFSRDDSQVYFTGQWYS